MILKTIFFFFFFFIAASQANPIDVDSDISWRVVGGSVAAPGQFPFILSLRTSTNSHTCGGSILRPNWAVTAAHCVSGMPTSYFTVVVGTNQLNDGNAVRVGVAEIIVHPEWDSWNIRNDVALLRLAAPLELTDRIQTVELETEYNDSPRDSVLVGWGRLAAGAALPNDLQFLNSKTITFQQCYSMWVGGNTVYDTEICTLTQTGEGACNGDSGGPLLSKENNKFKLIGLVSWGSPCARGMPDVYTRVASFAQWINDNIN